MTNIQITDLLLVIKLADAESAAVIRGGLTIVRTNSIEWSNGQGSGGCYGELSGQTTTFVCGDGNWMTSSGGTTVSGNFNSANSAI